MLKHTLKRLFMPLAVVSVLAVVSGDLARAQVPPAAQSALGPALHFEVRRASERMEMTVNTTRILKFNQRIKTIRVNDPNILDPQPLSPNEISLSAQARPGVTQVHLWDENGKVYTIDVIVYADIRELKMHLATLVPNASLKIVPIGQSLLISGYVDRPEDVALIMRIAEEYSGTVIDDLTLSGVHQVALQVKVIEVSRTKLRQLGSDWQQSSGANLFNVGLGQFLGAAGGTFGFSVIDGGNTLTALIDALRDDRLAKICAEPTQVVISGRPAMFQVGGEIGYPLAGGITGPSAEFKEYGTRIDFVPIVLGNGRIRLEIRALVSEIDRANSVGSIPALKTRQVETGVELQAGQTLAIAGLLQTRTETQNRGLPWISEVPYLGVPFRRVEHQKNEVELLILVTPQLVDPMDAQDVPKCLPGQRTTSPSDFELFFQGHLEVPNCCPDGQCAQCAKGGNAAGIGSPELPQGSVIIDESEKVVPPHGNNSARAGRRQGPVLAASGNNRQTPSKPQIAKTSMQSAVKNPKPGFIGAIGYDVVK